MSRERPRTRRALCGLDSPRRDGERGAQAIEFAAVFPALLFLFTLTFEAFTAFTALERIESAARAGARVAGPYSMAEAEAAARDSLPGWLDDAEITTGFSGEGVYTEVSYETPFLWKNAPFNITLERRADMPLT